MLAPFGVLLVNQRDEEEENDPELPDTAASPPPSRETVTSIPYTHEGDLEDALADEVPRNMVTSEIVIHGQKTFKARALRHRMAYQSS